VGIFQRLRGEAPPPVGDQRGPDLLRTHSLQNVADITLTEELLEQAALGDGVVRRLHGDLAYRSEALKEALAEVGVLLQTEPAERRPGTRQRIEITLLGFPR
jgi:hypothetical protein